MPKKSASKQGEGGGQGAELGRSFDEVIAEWVGKVLTERWLPTAFAGTAVLALLLFILMIIGFARDPEEAAKEKIGKLDTRIETLEKELAGTRDEKKKAVRDAGTSGHELDRAKEKATRLEDKRKILDSQLKELRKQLDDARTKQKEFKGQLRSAEGTAARDKQTVERDRDRALRDVKAMSGRLAATETQLAETKKHYNELRSKQEEAQTLYQKAREVFESIVKTVGEIEDPGKKIEAIERLRAASSLDLRGTEYMARLDSMIERERGVLGKAKRIAVKKAKREAKVAYADYTKNLSMTTDHEAAMTMLAEAKREFEELEDAEYVSKIDALTARRVHDEVMRTVASQPKAYEENLKRLEEALEKTKGTRWAVAIKKHVDSRRRTLPDDVARVLYEELVSRNRLNPDKHDENIAYAEEIKPNITRRYEKHFAKQLAAIKAAKLETIGRKALSEAQDHVTNNPKDHDGNIRALLELKSRAAGSRYEAKLQAMVEREKKLLLRAGK